MFEIVRMRINLVLYLILFLFATIDLSAQEKCFDFKEVSSNLSMALKFEKKGDIDKAIFFAEKAFKKDSSKYGKENYFVFEDAYYLQQIYSYLGQYDKSLHYGSVAIEIAGTLSYTNLCKLSIVQTQSLSCLYLHNYKRAIYYLTQEKDLVASIDGKENDEYATILNNLAYCYVHEEKEFFIEENVQEAIILLTEAIDIRRRLLGDSSITYLNTLNNYSRYLSLYSNAQTSSRLVLFREAAEIVMREELYNYLKYHCEDSVRLPKLYTLLSQECYINQEYYDALYYGIASLCAKNDKNYDSESIVTSLEMLAKYYNSTSDPKTAVALIEQAIKLRLLKSDDTEHLNELRGYYYQQLMSSEVISNEEIGDVPLSHIISSEKQKLQFDTSLSKIAIDNKTKNEENHRCFISNIFVIAATNCLIKQDTAKAVYLYEKSIEKDSSNFNALIGLAKITGTKDSIAAKDYLATAGKVLEDKQGFSPEQSRYFFDLAMYYSKKRDDSKASWYYSRCLDGIQCWLQNNFDILLPNERLDFFKRFSDIFYMAPLLMWKNPSNLMTQNAVDSRLITKNILVDWNKKFLGWKDLSNSLTNKEALVDLIELFDYKGEYTYNAILILPNNQIEKVYICTISKDSVDKSKKLNNYEWLWKPIEEKLPDTETVYFTTEKSLNTLPIENYTNLPFEAVRISALREILNKNKTTHATNNSILLCGGVRYSEAHDTVINRKRGSLNDISASTQIEVNNISTVAKKNEIKVTILNGNVYEKDFIEKLSDEYSIIHIATHGYYWGDIDVLDIPKIYYKYYSYFNEIANELCLSGFLLTGAEESMRDPIHSENNNDGIVTALEISKLDLNSTDLVSISACKSGLNYSNPISNYTVGLTTALKKAGVKSILVSLWDIDDDATQLFISSFYEKYLSCFNKHKALKHAQNILRNYSENGKLQYDDPYFWAGFILIDSF